MKYGSIPGFEKPLSRLVQGCMALREENQREEAFPLLDAAYEAGITAFDNGHIYGGGQCDRVFGAWARDRDLEDKVVILAKGCHPDGNEKRVHPKAINSDIADTLDRRGDWAWRRSLMQRQPLPKAGRS